MTERLALLLADYDGKSVAILEEIRARLTPDPGTFDEVLDLACGPDPSAAAGATWLLRAWLEAGVLPPADFGARLSLRLTSVDSDWARLHLCQAIGLIAVSDEDAPAVAGFLRAAVASPRPFLRAWAMDGLVRLAEVHPHYRADASATVERGLSDPAASVRARARRIVRETD